MRRILALAAAGAVLCAPAAIADPQPVDPQANVVEELVVTAHAGGPAWWRVVSDKGSVWILGVPEALPKGLAWDQTLLRRRLQGAHELIGPPTVTAGLGDVFALLRLRGRFRSHGRMEESLPAPLRARYAADRAKLAKSPDAYAGWTPLVAALLIVQDARTKAGLVPLAAAKAAVGAAHAAHVKVVPSGSYRAVPLLRAAQTGLEGAGPACLSDALDEVEAGSERARVAAEGWARGEVAQALTASRGYEKCLASLPEGADIADKAAADAAQTVAEAADAGGKSLAVIDLRTLLSQSGVLQRLKARGYRVETPA